MTENNLTLTQSLEKVYTHIQTNGYHPDGLDAIREELDHINHVLDLTDLQTILLTTILEDSYESYATVKELTSEMNISNIRFIGMKEDMDLLASRRYITVCRSGNNERSFRIPSNTLKAIQENRKPDYEDISHLTPFALFRQLMKIFRAKAREDMTALMALHEIDDLMVHNQEDNSFVKKCMDVGIHRFYDTNKLLAFYLFHRRQFFQEKEYTVDELCNVVAESELDVEEILEELRTGESELMKTGIIEFDCIDGIVDNNRLRLTDMVDHVLLKDVLKNEQEPDPLTVKIPADELIPAASIQKQELYYNRQEEEQIRKLERVLDEKNFKKVQERLEKKHFSKGFVALFYGAPGTGKTASVMELARKSGRDVYFVDQSKLRSKWHGESEKAMRNLFRNYGSAVRSSKLCPILVLNECDSMMYKRTEDMNSSNDQTNNSLVNIILNELEHFEGILLATSNLAKGLDEAFERRILFKVKFEKPGKEVRKKIWASKIEELTPEAIELLAEKYEFSGGQIENIARKANIDYVLNGEPASMDDIEKDCGQETIQAFHKTGRIGF